MLRRFLFDFITTLIFQRLHYKKTKGNGLTMKPIAKPLPDILFAFHHVVKERNNHRNRKKAKPKHYP